MFLHTHHFSFPDSISFSFAVSYLFTQFLFFPSLGLSFKPILSFFTLSLSFLLLLIQFSFIAPSFFSRNILHPLCFFNFSCRTILSSFSFRSSSLFYLLNNDSYFVLLLCVLFLRPFILSSSFIVHLLFFISFYVPKFFIPSPSFVPSVSVDYWAALPNAPRPWLVHSLP